MGTTSNRWSKRRRSTFVSLRKLSRGKLPKESWQKLRGFSEVSWRDDGDIGEIWRMENAPSHPKSTGSDLECRSRPFRRRNAAMTCHDPPFITRDNSWAPFGLSAEASSSRLVLMVDKSSTGAARWQRPHEDVTQLGSPKSHHGQCPI